MKLSSRDKLILAEALQMFIKKAWKDFELMSQNPTVKQSKLIELENHNKMLADLLVRLLGKPRAVTAVEKMIEELENGNDTGGESQETGKSVPS